MRKVLLSTVARQASNYAQITFDKLRSGSYHTEKNGWETIEVKDKDEHIAKISNIIGGRYSTRHKFERLAKSGRLPYHWAMTRIIYNKERKTWNYCAGQDYTHELNQFRRHILKSW